MLNYTVNFKQITILAPTRELAQQIHSEAKKFCKAYNINSACAYGGGSLYEQTLACQEGIELLVYDFSLFFL